MFLSPLSALFVLICIFLFGLCIGSFLNVVIYRFNTGRSIAKGRSKCGSCGKTLHWYELIPLASYIFQRARCRGCKASLALQYPLVELATGFIFVAIFYLVFVTSVFAPAPISLTAFLIKVVMLVIYYWIQASLLTVIFVYDLRHKMIPSQLSYIFAGLALIKGLVTTPSLSFLIAGILVALPLFAIWAISKGKWMGFGDVELALGIGWFLGISSGFASLMLSFWIGAIVGILVMLFQRGRGLTMKSEIPFAPFLIIGVALAHFFNIDFFSLMNLVSFL